MNKPLLIGVYKKQVLIKTIKSNEQTSEALPRLISEIFDEFKDVKAFYYAKGPGAYLSVKLVYVFLQSIFIIKHIPFFGAMGFAFNNNTPIKALGNKFFFYNKKEILELNNTLIDDFYLPKKLDIKTFTKDNKPNYNLSFLN